MAAVCREAAPRFGCPRPSGALQIYEPGFWLPRLGRPGWLARLTARRRFQQVYDTMRAQGCTKIVLTSGGSNSPKRSTDPAQFEHLQRERRVFVFLDRGRGVSRGAPAAKSVGQVFIISPALMKKKDASIPTPISLPAGVDYWSTPLRWPNPRTCDHSSSQNRISGTLETLDWPLLLELSASHPQWSFVFVGPKSPHPTRLTKRCKKCPAVQRLFLGGRPAERLGNTLQHFDVCTMPYVVDDYTKYIYPGKCTNT